MGKKSLFLGMLAMALSVCTAQALADITTGLVGHWPLDGDAIDASGNAANGTINGNVTPVPDREGAPDSAMRFDGAAGTNINAGNPSQLQITGAITLAAWVSLDGGQTNNARIVSKAGGSGNRCWSLNIENDSGGVRYPATFQIARNGTTNISVLDTQSLPTDEWVHMAGVYHPGEATEVYVNGELRAANTTDIPATQFNSSLAVLIGNRAGASNCGWIGMIDDVRIYNRDLSAADIMELVVGQAGLPSRPRPANDKDDTPVQSALSWTPGEFALTHDVYLGKDFSDVNDASVANPLGVLLHAGHDANAFDPGPLEFGTTYYWRVDEVNGPPDHTVYKGDVWSFTTEPLAYLVTDIQATASSSVSANAVPANLVNNFGLTLAADGSGEWAHGTKEETMWQSAMYDLPATVAFQFDQAYKLYQMKVWNHNTLNESGFGLGAKEVTIEVADSNEGPWTPLADVTLTKAGGEPDSPATDTILMNGVTASNVRLTIHSNHGGFVPTTGLAEVQFFYIPVAPRELTPADGTALEGTEVTLRWRSGREAAEHEVYLATQENLALVQGSDPTVLVGTLPAQGAYGSYDASGLNLGQTYIWKIAEVNAAQTPATHAGPVLSFTTPEFKLVDDMESYKNVEPMEIWATWLDGTEFGTDDPTNGSIVGADPYGLDADPDNNYDAASVGRGQSLPIWFTNTAAAPKSEATRNLQPAQDWTAHGIKSLSLWFRGDPDNTEGQLYVKINGTKVLYDGEKTDIKKDLWQPWNIDLSTVGGNLTNVATLAIGVEGVGAEGVIYIDDIRLYPKAPDFIIPVEPDSAGLLAHYDFETGQGTTAVDLSADKRNGTIIGAQWFSPGWDGQTGHCLLFDGQGTNRVDIGAFDVAGSGITIASWSRAYNLDTPGNDPRLVSKATGGSGEDHWWATGSCRVGSDKRVRFRLKTDGATTELQAGAAGVIGLDEWIHITATWDGATMRSYKNGVQVGSVAKGGTISIDPSVKVAIGNQPEGTGDRPWDGLIDDVRVYQRALSEEEILWLAGKRTPVHKPF